jgi:endonuclease/exonuclease/phosphatase family metal-dependent hydrolase
MPVFPKPRFPFAVDLAAEISRLRAWKARRKIPAKSRSRLLVATWNIANLGAQQRDDVHLQLIAEILGWFDVVAIQELRENYLDLLKIVSFMGPRWRMLFSDASGNNERMAFVYDTRKLSLLEEVGEISFPVSQLGRIKLPGVPEPFAGFDRTPYITAFKTSTSSFGLVNVHLFYGSEQAPDIRRRSLETFAVAKWADARRRSKYALAKHVFAMGDFNMPKNAQGDPVFDALTRLGLELPTHSTEVGSNLAADKHYDQIAYFPDESKALLDGASGVFDYDGALFPDLWQEGRNKAQFMAYLRYYVSDHRLMWIALKNG